MISRVTAVERVRRRCAIICGIAIAVKTPARPTTTNNSITEKPRMGRRGIDFVLRILLARFRSSFIKASLAAGVCRQAMAQQRSYRGRMSNHKSSYVHRWQWVKAGRKENRNQDSVSFSDSEWKIAS